MDGSVVASVVGRIFFIVTCIDGGIFASDTQIYRILIPLVWGLELFSREEFDIHMRGTPSRLVDATVDAINHERTTGFRFDGYS
jgi:hypothetical protein